MLARKAAYVSKPQEVMIGWWSESDAGHKDILQGVLTTCLSLWSQLHYTLATAGAILHQGISCCGSGPSSDDCHLHGSHSTQSYRFPILASKPSGSRVLSSCWHLAKGTLREHSTKSISPSPLHGALWRWDRPCHLSGMKLRHFSDWA